MIIQCVILGFCKDWGGGGSVGLLGSYMLIERIFEKNIEESVPSKKQKQPISAPRKVSQSLKKQISPPIPAPRTVFTTNKVKQPIKRKFILDEPIPDEIQERHKKTLKPSPHKQIEEYISEILKKFKEEQLPSEEEIEKFLNKKYNIIGNEKKFSEEEFVELAKKAKEGENKDYFLE